MPRQIDEAELTDVQLLTISAEFRPSKSIVKASVVNLPLLRAVARAQYLESIRFKDSKDEEIGA